MITVIVFKIAPYITRVYFISRAERGKAACRKPGVGDDEIKTKTRTFAVPVRVPSVQYTYIYIYTYTRVCGWYATTTHSSGLVSLANNSVIYCREIFATRLQRFRPRALYTARVLPGQKSNFRRSPYYYLYAPLIFPRAIYRDSRPPVRIAAGPRVHCAREKQYRGRGAFSCVRSRNTAKKRLIGRGLGASSELTAAAVRCHPPPPHHH